MDEKYLTTMIQDANADRVPDDLDLWSALEQQITVRQNGAKPVSVHTPSQRIAPLQTSRPLLRLRPRTRQLWLLASVMLVLLTATVAFAVQQMIQSGHDAGIDTMQAEGQTVPLKLTYTEGNASVTLDYAYADANRITVAYTYNLGVRHLATHELTVLGQLQTADGQVLVDVYSGQPQMGGGGGGGNGGRVETTPAYRILTQSTFQNFDAATIEGQPDQIALKFIVDYAVTSDMEGESYNGQAVFDFEIPFNPGIVVEDVEPVTGNEVTFTLNRLIAAPSMTRLDVCLESEVVSLEAYSLFRLTITHDGQTIYTGVPEIQHPFVSENPCRTLIIPDALQGYTGDWEIVVEHLISAEEPPIEAVIKAAEEEGIILIADPSGSGYQIEQTHYDSVEEIMAAYARLDQIGLDLREKWAGPWAFQVTLDTSDMPE